MPADPVDDLREPEYAVDNLYLSTTFVLSATSLTKPEPHLFHVFHTAYNYF